MSLKLIAQQLKIEPPVPEAIKRLIEETVQQQVADALEQQQPPREQPSPYMRGLMRDFNVPAPYTDYRQIPETAKPKPLAPTEYFIKRDVDGRIQTISAPTQDGDVQFGIRRDELGRAKSIIITTPSTHQC